MKMTSRVNRRFDPLENGRMGEDDLGFEHGNVKIDVRHCRGVTQNMSQRTGFADGITLHELISA